MDILTWPNNMMKNEPVLFVEKLINIGLDTDKIEEILVAIDTTCNTCYDTETSYFKQCACTMDW